MFTRNLSRNYSRYYCDLRTPIKNKILSKDDKLFLVKYKTGSCNKSRIDINHFIKNNNSNQIINLLKQDDKNIDCIILQCDDAFKKHNTNFELYHNRIDKYYINSIKCNIQNEYPKNLTDNELYSFIHKIRDYVKLKDNINYIDLDDMKKELNIPDEIHIKFYNETIKEKEKDYLVIVFLLSLSTGSTIFLLNTLDIIDIL